MIIWNKKITTIIDILHDKYMGITRTGCKIADLTLYPNPCEKRLEGLHSENSLERRGIYILNKGLEDFGKVLLEADMLTRYDDFI